MTSATDSKSPSDIEQNTIEDSKHYVYITADALNLVPLVDFVRSDEAGAVATFSGTTRNTFTVKGTTKKVLHLTYEAYIPMALSQLHRILQQAHGLHPSLIRTAVAHRLGLVPICQESVIITASSPHRKDALDAVSWIIDELKRKVPIWKREEYADGSVWKENAECNWSGGTS
ncbi:molybdopterin synthase [Spizellomyces sp. 'palustris']|nr:molybdopterin synthase [Spizellomyces sp. 'palustris']